MDDASKNCNLITFSINDFATTNLKRQSAVGVLETEE
jgi:hypothetical protein